MSGPTQEADLRPLQCEICFKDFKSKKNKRMHLRLIHQNSGRFYCGYCNKAFQGRLNLEEHERVHTGELPYACLLCPRRFNSKTNFTAHHLAVHTEKKFSCQYCSNAYSRKSKLNKHLEVFHSEEKPFHCAECPSRFPSSVLLKQHLYGCHPRKFHCETCGKEFEEKEKLKAHYQVHSSERFHCDMCESSFQHKRGLDRHQARQHLGTQRKTPGRRSLARNKVKEDPDVKVSQPNDSGGLDSSTYSLRTKSKPLNYKDDLSDVESDESSGSRSLGNSESDGHSQEPGQTRDDDMLDDVLDDEPDEEEQSNGRIEHDLSISASASRDRAKGASPTILLSSVEEEDEVDGDPSDKLTHESSIFSNASETPKASKFTLIKAETTAFDCYDFGDLIRKNQRRVKKESNA